MKVKKIKIKNTVELEKKIDEFLRDELPLVMFEEIYDLTYMQKKLFENRIIGYSKQTEKIEDEYGSAVDKSPEYLNIPHYIEEKYPLNKDIQRELLIEYNQLKNMLNDLDGKELIKLKEKYEELRNKINKFDKNKIGKVIDFLKDKKETTKAYGELTKNQINYLLLKNKIDIDESVKLIKMYDKYKKISDELVELEEKISIKEIKLNSKIRKLKQYQKRFDELKEELVYRNIKLVNWCIRKFFNNIPLPKEDAQMLGLEGLIKAIDGFNPYTKYTNEVGEEEYIKFSTYAVRIITEKIKKRFKELYGMSWNSFIEREIINYYRKVINDLENSDKYITASELQNTGLVDFSLKRIAELDRLSSFNSYLDQETKFIDKLNDFSTKRDFPVTEEEYILLDQHEDATSLVSNQDVYEIVSSKALKNQLNKMLNEINPRDKAIIEMRFGLVDGKEKTQEEVARLMGISHQRIDQIEKKVYEKLSHPSIRGLVGLYYGEGEYYDSPVNLKEFREEYKPYRRK